MSKPILASTDQSVESWLVAIDVLRRLPITLQMVANQVRFALRKATDLRRLSDVGIDGLFLFGSAARGEPAVDLDWIVVSRHTEVAHFYGRTNIHGAECDINVVSAEWLENAWKDPEWGYWLTESFPLAATPQVLDAWHCSANAYWSAGTARARCAEFQDIFELLARNSRNLSLCSPLGARLLGHEAVRIVLVALIDCYASRPFSHRTFVNEAIVASRRAKIDIQGIWNGLGVNRLGTVDDQSQSYVDIRSHISNALRSAKLFSSGYDRGASLRLRVESLVRLVKSGVVDDQLSKQGMHLFLPSVDFVLASLDAGQSLLRVLARPVIPKHTPRKHSPSPTQSVHSGIRWMEHVGKRLKVIVGTGGCKTPTCRFCSLPDFGRSSTRFDVSQLNKLLEHTQPSSLSFYNDGSLLNPAEFSEEQLLNLCNILRRHEVKHLQIESIPRFVVKERLKRIHDAAGLDTLSISMGFQAVGNAFSRLVLGRPDVDAIFERSLVEAREAGAFTRLYLLWGFGNLSISEWTDRLENSFSWISQRPVDRITVCPFVSTDRHQQVETRWICALRQALIDLSVPEDGRVDVSIPAKPSCGARYATQTCSHCEDALRTSSWSRREECRHSVEACP